MREIHGLKDAGEAAVVTRVHRCHKVRVRFVFDSEASNQPSHKESIMFSRREARLSVFVSVASVAVTLGVVFAYVAPAASNVNPAPLDDRSGVASFSTLRPWSENLSEDAVDSRGIERDLDGNAYSLYPSDQWCGQPVCGDPLLR